MRYQYSDGSLNWPQISESLIDTCSTLLTRWLAESSSPLYAAAFFGSYREYHATICLPAFAANSLTNVPTECGTGFYDSERWTPQDWALCKELEAEPLQVLQEALDIASANAALWPEIETQFVDCIVHCARILYQRFAHHPNVSANFVVFFDDEEGGIELARASLPPALHTCFTP